MYIIIPSIKNKSSNKDYIKELWAIIKSLNARIECLEHGEEEEEEKDEGEQIEARSIKKSDGQFEKDLPLMQGVEQVLSNLPDTWRRYQDNVQGACNILDMEYGEFKKAISLEEKEHEVIHLTAACLHFFRKLQELK